MFSFIIFELLLWGMLLIALIDAKARWGSKQTINFFVPLFIYGWVLEAAAIGIFKRYEYGTDFLVTLFDAPLCIAAGWASITYSGICIAQNYTNSHIKIALFTALWGLSIDYSMDGLAVLVGYWTWFPPEGVKLHYFDVPVSNFVGWFIILSFYTYFQLHWKERAIRQKLMGFDAILPALPALLISITIMINSEYERLFVSFPWWIMMLIFVVPVVLILLFWLTKYPAIQASENKVPLLIAHSYHGFFLALALIVGFYGSDWRYFIAAAVAAAPMLYIAMPAPFKRLQEEPY